RSIRPVLSKNLSSRTVGRSIVLESAINLNARTVGRSIVLENAKSLISRTVGRSIVLEIAKNRNSRTLGRSIVPENAKNRNSRMGGNAMLVISIIVSIILIASAIFIVLVSKSRVNSKEGGPDNMKQIYVYFVLFATLMMTIGGSVSVFMALADIVSPAP